MKSPTVRIAVVCSIMVSGMLCATSQFRSPLYYENRGVIYTELKPVKDTWWYSSVASEDCKERCWNWTLWTSVYGRSAGQAFFNDSIDCDGNYKNKSTRNTVSLSQLWFGIDTPATSFKGVQTLAGGKVSDQAVLANNSALGWSFITPKFTYDEKGMVWGFDARKKFGKDNRWYVGKRANLPFKIVEVNQCVDNSDGSISEGLEDVALERPLDSAGDVDPTQVEFAYRLDFLSTLALSYQDNLGQIIATPLVEYRDGSPTGGETQIAGFIVTAPNAGTDANANVPPVYAIRKTDGLIPAIPFRKQASQVTGSINPNGSGGINDSVLFFLQNTDYQNGLGLDNTAQSQLWIVPRRRASADQLVTDAQAVRDAIRAIIDANVGTINQTAADIFRNQCGIDLAQCERVVGLGDLNTELYLGYQYDNWFMDGMIGVLFPTGTKNSDPNRIYYQTTGNNGHFELKLGLEGGWNPVEWFAFRWDWAFHHAFERTEKRAAAFKDATIRNIAPTIDVGVKWDYWVLHADLNFFHPCNSELGAVISYELFAKNKDRVHLACPETECNVAGTALDCLGQSGQLDLNQMEKRTNSMTHKLRGEVFHRVAFGSLFGGASQVVAGRNAMKETEVHLGIAVYF